MPSSSARLCGAFALLLAAAACGAPASRAPISRPVPPEPALRDSLAAPWQVVPDGSVSARRITLRAVLQSRVDTVIRVDTLESRSDIAWSAVWTGAGVRVFGTVQSFALRRGADTAWTAVPGLAFPVAFAASAASAASQPLLTDPPGDGCDARSAVVAAWRETWVAFPPALQPGHTWRDSTTLPLCRDGIVLQSTVVRTFIADSVRTDGGARVLYLRRSAVTQLSGSGVQFGDSVRITGDGSGTARLTAHLPTGHVLTAEGRSELRLQLQGRRRTQQLVQLGALSISAQ